MSPLHSRLEEAGARWGQTMGWERPKWFTKSEDEPEKNRTFGKPVWFDRVGEEHLACREKAVLFDLTSFAKFDIQGPDAESALQKLCTNNVAVLNGKIVYTGMLSDLGGYVTDCTITRLAQDKYLATCPTDHVTHDAAWISRHLPPSTSLSDVTGRYSVLALMGPRSRDVLQRITKIPLDNEHFPFSTAQVIDVGFASGVRALRISYVGELGWELFVPTEFACGVYDQLMAVGGEYGLSNAGTYAFNNLRLEKGYRHYGHDIDTETTPWEAGLSFAVDMNKGDFIGRRALEQQKREGLNKMVVSFLVDTRGREDLFPWGHENIYRNGELVGYVTSAAFGYSVGGHICMGFVYQAGDSGQTVNSDFVKEGQYEIEINGERCPAKISLRPFYDPKSLRMKMYN